jgi:hypothetical protein
MHDVYQYKRRTSDVEKEEKKEKRSNGKTNDYMDERYPTCFFYRCRRFDTVSR